MLIINANVLFTEAAGAEFSEYGTQKKPLKNMYLVMSLQYVGHSVRTSLC